MMMPGSAFPLAFNKIGLLYPSLIGIYCPSLVATGCQRLSLYGWCNAQVVLRNPADDKAKSVRPTSLPGRKKGP